MATNARSTIICGLLLAAHAAGQAPPVPASYQSLYTELQTDLSGFSADVASQPAKSYPALMSAELLNANGNRGLALLSPNVHTAYLQELNALHSLGVQAVVVKMGYPLLYQPFLQFNGDPGDYPKFIAFFRQVVVDAHALGMKVIVESAAMFPGFYSTGSGTNLTGYFASITFADYLQGCAQVNANIVQSIQPDYLDVGSEPDTEARNTGFTQVNTPSGWAAAINSYMSLLPASPRIPIGAGIGTWIANAPAYLQAITSTTKVDYIDLHIYSVITSASGAIPAKTVALINTAIAAGKRVAFSEAWLLKLSASESGTTSVAGDPSTFSRDAFSFFAPLDQQFLTTMVHLASTSDFVYMSPFWSRYFWAYLDYNAHSSETPAEVTTASQTAAAEALQSGQVTSTGLVYKNLIAAQPRQPGVVSAASYSTGLVSGDSIVAVFAPGISTTSALAPSLPLPASLGGTTGSVRDNVGAVTPVTFFAVTPTQANILLPAGVASGPATLTLTTATGASIVANIEVGPIAPGIFAANAGGSGVAAATVVTVHAGGLLTTDDSAICSSTCTAKPINVSGAGDQVTLSLYGTGLRHRNSSGNVSVAIGGTTLSAAFAGAQPTFAGLDQVNVALPASLAGSGLVTVIVTVDGVAANAVQVQIQ